MSHRFTIIGKSNSQFTCESFHVTSFPMGGSYFFYSNRSIHILFYIFTKLSKKYFHIRVILMSVSYQRENYT